MAPGNANLEDVAEEMGAFLGRDLENHDEPLRLGMRPTSRPRLGSARDAKPKKASHHLPQARHTALPLHVPHAVLVVFHCRLAP